MLDVRSSKSVITQEKTFFSEWIAEKDVETFKKSLSKEINDFKKLEEEGYEVEVDINDRFDSDCFGDKDVVIVLISLTAILTEKAFPNERIKEALAKDSFRHLSRLKEDSVIQFNYTNWEGKFASRICMFREFLFDSTEWHKEEQLLVKGFDLDKQAERIYAAKDMSDVTVFTRMETEYQ